MSRQKGSMKTGGRKKGTPNKTTSTLKEWLTSLINGNRERMMEDLTALEPKDRLLVLEKLMRYILPIQQQQQINFNKLSDSELTELAEQLLNNTDDEEGK